MMRAYSDFGIDYPKFYKMDRLSQAGFLTTELLLSAQSISDYPPSAIATVFSNANSSLDTDAKYYKASRTVSSPALFVYTLPNIVQGEVSIRHKLKGENAFLVSEQFDAELLYEYVHQLLADNASEACIAGWIDVLNEHHDVLVYLVEKRNTGAGIWHSVSGIEKLYQ
jgi:hypothetical protein